MRLSLCLLAMSSLLLFACDHGHEHGEGGHAHGEEPEAAHGHAHGEAQPVERPTVSVTVYENGLELFMEYDAFVVGMESPLIAHFTDARDPEGFEWITAGSVVATLRYADGSEQHFSADKLLRNGIFKPIVKPTKAGKATLTLKLEGPQMQAAISAGDVVIHADAAAAVAAAPAEEASEPVVGYLKESQWKTVYATEAATPRVLQGGIRANGELAPVAGQAAELAAPLTGRLVLGDKVPFIGQPVKKGEVLVSIVPTSVAASTSRSSLELERSRAQSELSLSERELVRAEELVRAKAIPEKQLDAARAAHDVAKARVNAANRQLQLYQSAQGGAGGAHGAAFELRSPIDGIVSFAQVTRGAVVDAGERLISVVNADKLWLELKVYEADVAKVASSPGVMFSVAGFERDFVVDEANGRRVAVGAVVDAATRTVPIIFELFNESGELKPGMYAKATIFSGATVQGVAVPEQAIVDDNGQPVVFVMDGGETFFKRRVKLGVRSGGHVQILEGVRDGERVVSRGAYEVKLATAAGGIPEHGHQH